MDDASGPLGHRFLVVTRQRIVAEDLRQMLLAWGASGVDVASGLSDAWDENYAAGFFAVPLPDLLGDGRVRNLHRSGTRIVVVNGHEPESAYNGTGLSVLEQPFRTQDVRSVLRRIGLTA